MENSSKFNFKKYRPFAFAPKMQTRDWVNNKITEAPSWCSVDLRDGNQSLIDPMTIKQKIQFWKMLVKIGFKEIETGFPSASQTEFDFHRKLIEENLIPEDVTIQVLVQAREHLIEKTFEALKGCKKAVVHVYNSTSKVQREKVFEKTEQEITKIAVQGARLLKDYAKKYPETEWIFQYSPESFSQTEPDFAIAVTEAVCGVWLESKNQKIIVNLPATVEASTPNIFADQVEYFCKNIKNRKNIIISIHTHNDRGTAVAASELALLAGADRIEGTLFGNGERTGNTDLITLAMNLYTQGIDPKLDLSDIAEISQCVSSCNNIEVHPRHPYVGDLVFTAFSGSHQDAIKKCLDKPADDFWEVAYLPINPTDLGRTYQDIVRINSQSGKGGIAYILQQNYGVILPKWLQIDFSKVVQKFSESKEKELTIEEIWTLFENKYLTASSLYSLKKFNLTKFEDGDKILATIIDKDNKSTEIEGRGAGTLTSFIRAMEKHLDKTIRVLNYTEHSLSSGTRAQAIAYVQIEVDGKLQIGVARNQDTVTAMLKAALFAIY